jgi:hypothetical protein
MNLTVQRQVIAGVNDLFYESIACPHDPKAMIAICMVNPEKR